MPDTSSTLQVALGLLFGVAVLATFSRRLQLPYPSVLALGGLLLALLPGLPRPELPPDLVLLVFLPPLMFDAGRRIAWRELLANLRPIVLLAVGLVLFTTAGVGLAAWAIAGLPLGAAMVLGAIVSPTDPLAAGAVARNLRLPRRLMTILECESVANDATGLVVYRIAVAALLAGGWSPTRALASLVVVSLGGTALGLVAGWLSVQLSRRIDDPPVAIAIQLLGGYAAYLPAELLGLSGVFAAATAGLYAGHRQPWALGARSRLQATAFWDTFEFLINAVLFLLLGLQLPVVLAEAGRAAVPRLLAQGAAVAAVAIGLRVGWVFAATWLPRALLPRRPFREPAPTAGAVALVGWAGMRGVLSLATALALPRTLASGAPLPGRAAVVFFAFLVIVATLVVQGLSLPLVARRLGLPAEQGDAPGERAARLATARAALEFLAELDHHADGASAVVASLRRRYQRYFEHLQESGLEGAERHVEYARLRREVAARQRQVLLDLHRRQAIDDPALQRLQRELDLEDQRE